MCNKKLHSKLDCDFQKKKKIRLQKVNTLLKVRGIQDIYWLSLRGDKQSGFNMRVHRNNHKAYRRTSVSCMVYSERLKFRLGELFTYGGKSCTGRGLQIRDPCASISVCLVASPSFWRLLSAVKL